ncbi:hypothetical protein ACTXT7_017211 [Hymenolepis weldensis]
MDSSSRRKRIQDFANLFVEAKEDTRLRPRSELSDTITSRIIGEETNYFQPYFPPQCLDSLSELFGERPSEPQKYFNCLSLPEDRDEGWVTILVALMLSPNFAICLPFRGIVSSVYCF